MEFLVVQFSDDGIFDIISSAWLAGNDHCYFPSDGGEFKMRNHIGPSKQAMESGTVDPEAWDKVPIRIISKKGKLNTLSIHAFRHYILIFYLKCI